MSHVRAPEVLGPDVAARAMEQAERGSLVQFADPQGQLDIRAALDYRVAA